jgi:hypothetical protein
MESGFEAAQSGEDRAVVFGCGGAGKTVEVVVWFGRATPCVNG